jgi:CubicO group peptidase (beta-lactamase class C family)
MPRGAKGADDTDPKRQIQESDLISALSGLKLANTPGATTLYSNYANCLAGVVIHRASGEPYRDFIAEHIEKPLGLHLAWSPETVPAGRLAIGHDLGPDKKTLVEVLVGWRLSACDSAGGLYASLDDLTAFASFELGAWPPSDAPENPAATRATLRESQTPQGNDFGVNWVVHDDRRLGRLVWHNGAVAGYVAELFLVPDSRFAVVALLGDGRFDSSEGRLQALARSAIAEVEPFLPDGNAVLSPEVQVALERLIACIEPGGPMPTKWLSPHLRQLFKPGELEPFVQWGRGMGGNCRLRKVLSSDPLKATVRLVCSDGALDLYARILPEAPHLIGGWRMTPAP